MVLTVLLPSLTGNESSEVNISCIGCTVTLQQRRYEETGCANQKWEYDETLKFILPFNSNQADKEITAANRANICSYTVNYDALSQPGFYVSILNINDQAEDVPVCLACAQAMRGKYRLVKIEPHIKFTCAIGKRTDLKFNGPFHCLNHKVDLTHDEAENTLFQRQDQLEQLRQEASVRNIAKELAAAKPIQILHLLAYRNGDGHTKQGQLLIGSSIIGLLDQATHRLSLSNAARRLYVNDGTVILTIEDLIQWTANYYRKRFNELSKSNQSTAMLDKVELSTPLPPKSDSQRRASLDNQSERTTFSAKLRDISPSKQRFLNLPKYTDLKRAMKSNTAKQGLEIDMDYLLKFPIEVWVSSGEPFVRPNDADQRQNLRFNQREQRTPIEHDLEKERHTLRLMKGRRISAQSPGELIAQQNPDVPVVKQGHWTQKTDAELDKQDDVELLRNSLDELRLSQQPEITRPISSTATDRLGQHSKIKRVMIYLNGESKDSTVQCFGSNLNELMDNAKLKLNLMQPIQALFTENGELIERFDQLVRDQLVCVATSKTFITANERQREVDIKANWARTRNRFGDQATDIRVNSTLLSFPQSVDPFGPPLLTLDDQQQLHPTSKPPPAPFYRRLAIEQPAAAPPQPPTTTTTSAFIKELSSTPTMAKDSLVISEDESDGPNSEIERITNVQGNDDDDDDENKSNRQITSTNNERATSPFSQLFATQPTRTNGNLPSTNKSDNNNDDDDDDDDEFIKMLKRK